MFAGLNAAYGVGPNIPPPTPGQEKAAALELVSKAAARHAEALQAAVQVSGVELVPQPLVDAILSAGAELDKCLAYALRRGATAEELAGIDGLHTAYVRELLSEDPRWSI